tara:strand:+ start:221 stop:421 length:201 start_codon:yes stop_codon:yes gene_type:complete
MKKIKSIAIDYSETASGNPRYVIKFVMGNGKTHKAYSPSYDYALDIMERIRDEIRSGGYNEIKWDN